MVFKIAFIANVLWPWYHRRSKHLKKIFKLKEIVTAIPTTNALQEIGKEPDDVTHETVEKSGKDVSPMLIDLILDRVFVHLDVESLKNSRLVCSKWAAVSKAYLIWKSRICIPEFGEKRGIFLVKKILEEFEESLDLPLTKFHFVGPLNGEDFDSFLNSRDNLKELTLEHCSVISDNKEWMWKCNNSQLNYFELDTELANLNLGMTIDLSYFRTTETIKLKGGKLLKIVLYNKISPVVFSIGGSPTVCTHDGIPPYEIVLNDYVDSLKLKRLEISIKGSDLKLDLTDCHKLEIVHLVRGRVTGWNNELDIAAYAIKFEIPFTPKSALNTKNELYTSKSRLQFENLEMRLFLNIFNWSDNIALKKLTLQITEQFDISRLPKSVEMLKIEKLTSNVNIICSAPYTTHFLKLTHLFYDGEFPVYHFCPALENLAAINCKLDLQKFPVKKIRELFLSHSTEIVGTVGDDGPISVDKMIVDFMFHATRWEIIEDLLENFKIAEIIVSGVNFAKSASDMISEKVLQRLHNSIRKQMEGGGVFHISKIQWNDSGTISEDEKRAIFTDSQLPPLLMDYHHSFENGYGKVNQFVYFKYTLWNYLY